MKVAKYRGAVRGIYALFQNKLLTLTLRFTITTAEPACKRSAQSSQRITRKGKRAEVCPQSANGLGEDLFSE